MSEPLDKLGALVVRSLHDKIIEDADALLRAAVKSPATQELQRKLAQLSPDQKKVVRELVERLAVTGTHDLLFALQEEGSVRIVVDGADAAVLSDGLHGELFSSKGWIARFSRSPKEANQPPQTTTGSSAPDRV